MLATAPLGDHSPASRRLILDTIRYLQARADNEGSRTVSQPLLDRWQSILGVDHPDTLTAESILTSALVQGGKAASGRALGEDTLQRCRRVLGPNHTITLWAAAGLIHALIQLGEMEAARALAKDTLQRCRRVRSPDDPVVLYLTRAASIGHLMLGGDAVTDHPRRPQ